MYKGTICTNVGIHVGMYVCNSCILPWCAVAHQGRIQLLCVMVKRETFAEENLCEFREQERIRKIFIREKSKRIEALLCVIQYIDAIEDAM